jgi:hypothetical protein
MAKVRVISQGQINEHWVHLDTCEHYLKLREFSYFDGETTKGNAIENADFLHECMKDVKVIGGMASDE